MLGAAVPTVARDAHSIPARFDHRRVRRQFVREYSPMQVGTLVAQSPQSVVTGISIRAFNVDNLNVFLWSAPRVPHRFIEPTLVG
jgi:hypothetical protein